MGYSRWDAQAYTAYSDTTSLRSMSTREVFSETDAKAEYLPKNFLLRESRDSDINPQSTPVILGSDVTGSMGEYAAEIVQTHLPVLMTSILNDNIITDPHIMVMGIGDARAYDRAPVQATQFETDIRIVEQMRSIFLEAGGGGNGHESYDFAWQFALNKTVCDAFERKGEQKGRGFIFTFGDENPADEPLPLVTLKRHFGVGEFSTFQTMKQLVEATQQNWNVFHVVIEQGGFCSSSSSKERVKKNWTKLLGNRALFLADSANLPQVVTAAMRLENGASVESVRNEFVAKSGDSKKVFDYTFANLLAE
jgi:hypothetical protein